jgi:3-methylcrotonyl-CoA carboxylase alpha subunit
VIIAGQNYVVIQEDPLAPPPTETAGDECVAAPIPGRVARVLAQPGDVVEKNAPLVVIEAMKMELTLRAPRSGKIAKVFCAVDEMVEEGAEIVTFMTEERA